MRSFILQETMDLVPASLVRLLARVDRGKGNEEFRSEVSPRALSRIANRAKQ